MSFQNRKKAFFGHRCSHTKSFENKEQNTNKKLQGVLERGITN